eukprot:CAMPEP_0195656684 /NCGR_PEP_ID=MMETSP0815-20121206/35125_1 /TAXON_ID=97485 /ORGANISM="Prymnesium parvum, Strain Texoma1" /LENGTH=67 /DNA_ID=CAMNT_0040801059 /DNA_START=887 /DNA_END=1086 /DNA_ORIENTATION=-
MSLVTNVLKGISIVLDHRKQDQRTKSASIASPREIPAQKLLEAFSACLTRQSSPVAVKTECSPQALG